MADKDKQVRPESYPKPTETDEMMKNQDEFSTLQPNSSQEMMSGNLNEQTTGKERGGDDLAGEQSSDQGRI